MVDPDEDSSERNLRRGPSMGPDKQVKLSFLYPATTSCNIDQALRAVDSLQKATESPVATPANWKPGEPLVIAPAITDNEARHVFPAGFETKDLPSKKNYLCFTNA